MFQKTDSHNKDKMYFFGVCIYIFFRDIFFSVKATETRDLTAFLSAEIPFKCIYLEYGRVYFAVIVYTRLPFLYIEVICLKKKQIPCIQNFKIICIPTVQKEWHMLLSLFNAFDRGCWKSRNRRYVFYLLQISEYIHGEIKS